MATSLSALGYQTVVAHNGDDAIARVERLPVDVAIVDLEMPAGGLVVIERLKELSGPAVHVITMTGHDDERHRAAAFEAGTDDFIVKPTGLVEIKRRLSAAVRNQRAYVETRLAKEVADRRMAYGEEASAMLAHDLNNSLAVSLVNLQLLRDELESNLDGEQADMFITSLRALRRMSTLVANFVDVGRFEDAAVKPRVASVDVPQMLRSVVDMTAPSSLTVTVDCPDSLRGVLDSALVERVLHNLVGNAVRYCRKGGAVTVSAAVWHDPGSVKIIVTNSGPLIDDALRPTLFDKYSVGMGGKRGMGLYFCRLAIEAHGGRIDYEPVEIGPSFVIRLPGRE